ncbi:prenyltransferase [Furfurilactobacillus sp. WILCCON 0119]|uniref:prenyltransferase n=1 Tax=Furfurilactobacillus entadae TaxID=2922307 RepID=UPI0035EF1346
MKKKWLTWPIFVELTEIYTAPLNIVWFILGAAIAQSRYGIVNWVNVLLCLVDVFIFDLAVNVSDNYYDYVHAADREGYAAHTNPLGRLQLPLRGVWWLAASLYALSAVPGLFLIMRTGWPILVFGLIGYAIGIFYTAGPKPLNAMPICEAVVALSISYLIQLVCVYVSIYGHQPFTIGMVGTTFTLCLPLTLIFFMVQLSNNTADLEEDIKNHRHTLAYFIGRKRAVALMKVLLVVGSLWPLVNFFAGIAPWPTLLSVLLLPVMWRGIQPFFAVQDKQKTYGAVLKSTALFFVGYTVLFALGVWL